MKFKKEKTFKIVLSKKGKDIYKGGNIEVMKKALKTFKAKTTKEVDDEFYRILNETIGWASYQNYQVEEIK